MIDNPGAILAAAIVGSLFFILSIGALIWGGQGDGYHRNPNEAADTSKFMALALIIFGLLASFAAHEIVIALAR